MQFRRCPGVAVTAVVALLTCAGLAQQPPPSPLRVLAESIPGAVPAEFAADLMIRIADSPGAAKEGARWRATLYQDAFDLAGAAQDPLPRVPVPDRTLDLQTRVVANASRMLGLDTLSLRVRAIQGLQEFRTASAIELTQRLDARLPSLTCRDALVPNPTAMFDVARLLPYEAFERRILLVRSSTEVGPALQAVLEKNLSDEQSQRLLVALATTLRGLRDDDASFSASGEAIWTAVKRALDRAGDAAVAGSLLEAFRSYAVHHLTAERCAPAGTKALGFVPADSAVVADINAVLVAHDRLALSPKELTPARVLDNGAASSAASAALSTPAKALTAALAELRTEVAGGPPVRRPPAALEERSMLGWHEPLTRIRALMERWTAHDERSAVEYFHARRFALGELIQLLPPGIDRDQTLGELIAFLKSEGIERYSHVEWFLPVHQLLLSYKGSATERDWMLRALLDSGDPVMRMYAEVEQLIG
jgi:hypothetical protein